MQHNKKLCPALVGMCYMVDGVTSATKIGKMLGVPTMTAWQILDRKYRATEKRKRYSDEFIDAVEREYLDGASTYTLAEKYGVCHETIGKWMKKRGHVRGKGYVPKERLDKNAEAREASAAIRREQMLERKRERDAILQQRRAEREAEKEQHRLEREAEYAKEKLCAVCGSVFHSEYENARFCSNECRKSDKIKKKNEREKRKTAARQAEELEKEKTCASCGKLFHSVYESAKYCTECHNLARYCDHKERAKRYGVEYDPSVTLEKLIERDNNVCQICGETCDKTDRRYGSYGPLSPSTDHIIAMANGGGHIWSNVQLAHVICNAIKRDLSEEELTDEVIAHAKEQAIAHKCA